jgi:hypothetical protein
LGKSAHREPERLIFIPAAEIGDEESCIRKAVTERGSFGDRVGLSDTISLNEAGSRWADCRLPLEIE